MSAAQTVGLIFGGRSVEHRVSIRSARTVAEALAAAGFGVHPLGIALDGCWLDAESSQAALTGGVETLEPVGGGPRATLSNLLAAPIDVAFPLVHGTWGEDGTLQGLFEIADLPYVGAGVAASAIAIDKVQCKRVLEAVGIQTVDFVAIGRRRWQQERAASLARARALGAGALFVKPAVGGSSVGIRRVANGDDLGAAIDFALGFDDTVLVERSVDGRELECAVLGFDSLSASRVGEIRPGNDFYDYADKYLEDNAGLEAPARLSEQQSARIRELAIEAFAAIGGVGMARVDFLLEGEERLFVNEINTLPGFTDISMYPKLWTLSGLPLPELVTRLVDIAQQSHDAHRRLNDGIKSWIENL